MIYAEIGYIDMAAKIYDRYFHILYIKTSGFACIALHLDVESYFNISWFDRNLKYDISDEIQRKVNSSYDF